ncbi:sensor histidine kinase [Phytohabitans sp. LJ34]|uniref:sensor histidine kinase n=1 Tax=Phytohabitans sp. LJ34 TaxID=3452217 RepID=UPI003F8C8D1D
MAGDGAAALPTVVAAPVAAGAPAEGQVRRARAVVVTRTIAYVFAVGMLGFGLLPIVNAVVRDRPLWTLVVGSVMFAIAALAFVRVVTVAMKHPWRNRTFRQTAVVVGIVIALPVLVDPDWQVIGFLPVAAVTVSLRPRYGLLAALAVLAVLTVERGLLGVSGAAFLTLQDLLTGMTLAGIIVLVAFVEELFAARAEIARLAVTAERSRFARDLHDTLGHNLSAIALKSELALRLLDADPVRTRTELLDVHDIARESLRDVRTVVKGYRRDSLERELTGVQSVLVSAGVRCEISPLVASLPAPVEEALAWAVREAATNLLRHSRASRCDITVEATDTAARLTVVNDGAGQAEPDTHGGSGLAGLAERLNPLGGRLAAAAQPNGEFMFTVDIPIIQGRNP